MNILAYLKDHLLYLDGGMGTLLQERGLAVGELPERWNVTHPRAVCDVHRAYYDAGSNVVLTNTFGANLLKYSEAELEEIVAAAIANAKKAAEESVGHQEKWVALDIGPTGKMLKPYGDLDFEDAVALFSATARLGEKYGADLIFIETMSDSYETKAALLAAKESTSLPAFVSNAYGEDGKLMTGATPAAMVAMLEGLGADAIGVNCSLGPRVLAPVVEEYLRCASVPVILKPNAGLPQVIDRKTVFNVTPNDFADELAVLANRGARVLGGCCGTTPDHIGATVRATQNLTPVPITEKAETVISSYARAVSFADGPVLIGERINPTGKKRFKEALRARDMDYILKEGIAQEEAGAAVLDVNVGLPEIDEPALLTDAVCELQAVTALPLQIDTSDPVAMERALRRYNGKALVNSVNGKEESLAALLPLVKKYGGVVVGLTLDENGIPETAEGRVAIAARILARAQAYGIPKKDVIIDPLALTVSADPCAAKTTLEALSLIREELGLHTSLGVSNVSFGLPMRDTVNAAFFAQALSRGLGAAILNPHSREMMTAYYTHRLLDGKDENCAAYISFAETLPKTETLASASINPAKNEVETAPFASESPLIRAIVKGMRDAATAETKAALQTKAPLAIVEEEIIPALDRVGVGYEEKRIYLPQLLVSAEAAKAAFEVIRAAMPVGETNGKGTIILATVKGDIHDIGKNIVKLLLENYGFSVCDLGRDVSPEAILSETLKRRATLVGLSALMTTTVPAMEEAVRLVHENAPFARVMVGGAVLTAEYAGKIGADHYAKDAMAGVRYAESVLTNA